MKNVKISSNNNLKKNISDNFFPEIVFNNLDHYDLGDKDRFDSNLFYLYYSLKRKIREILFSIFKVSLV